jgi:hypothetical protein
MQQYPYAVPDGGPDCGTHTVPYPSTHTVPDPGTHAISYAGTHNTVPHPGTHAVSYTDADGQPDSHPDICANDPSDGVPDPAGPDSTTNSIAIEMP